MHPSSRWALFMLAVTVLLAALPLVSAHGTASEARQRDAILAQQAARSLSAGELLPRWAPDLGRGYGSPWFLFHAPVAYLLPGACILLGVPAPVAVTLVLLATLAGAACLAFLLGRELWGPPAGALLALLYVLSPWHPGRLEGLSGSLALCWPPLALWAVRRLERRQSPWYAALATLALAALPLTDLPAARGLGPALGLYLLVDAVARRRLQPGVDRGLIAAGAASVAAFFWLPAWWETGHLLLAPVSATVAPAGETPLAGWLLLAALVGLGGTWLAHSGRSRAPGQRWGLLSLCLAALGLILVALELHPALAAPRAWLHPWLDPGRVLGWCLPLAAAFLAHRWLDGAARWALPAVALLLAAGTHFGATGGASQAVGARWDVPASFRPHTVVSLPPPRSGKRFPPPAGCQLDQERSQATLYFFDAVCAEPAVMETGLFHYPGWTVYVDNQAQEPDWEPRHGTLRIPLSAGVQRVKVSFEHTPLRRNAYFLSLAAMVLLAAWWLSRGAGTADDP